MKRLHVARFTAMLCVDSFWIIGFPIILDIIWIKRVKSGKSKIFGPLGIISIIVTVSSLLYLPQLFTMIGEFFGWI